MAVTCELVIVEGKPDQKGQVLLMLAGQRRTIGRSSACDFVIDDDQLSGMHCELVSKDGRWILRDLLSRNGVEVNGALADEVDLANGATVRIGYTTMRFDLSGSSGTKSGARPTHPVISLDAPEPIDPLRQTKVDDAPPRRTGVPLGRKIEKKSDVELAKLALKNDLLTHVQLRECVDIQREMREVKIQMALEEIFQEREYLTRDQIQGLMREYKFTRRRTKDLLYAEVATGNGLVDQAKVDACLALQEQAFRTGDKIPYLGELLVKQGHLSVKDNNRIIKGIKAYKEEDQG